MSARPFATNRRSAILIYEIALGKAKPASPQWQPGPIALHLPGTDAVTDATWRCSWLHERAQLAAYGHGRRWHGAVSPGLKLPASELEVSSVEILRLPHGRSRGTDALLVVHTVPGTDGLAFIADLQRCARNLSFAEAGALKTALTSLLPTGTALSVDARSATVLVFATLAMNTTLSLESTWDGDTETWGELDLWRWALAAASPPSKRSRQTPQMPLGPGKLVRMPRREAQILGNGIAILGTRRDTRAAAGTNYDFDFVASASIYLDVLLLGVGQRIQLAQLVDEAGSLRDPVARPRKMRELQRDVRVFRNEIWWRDASSWRWADLALRAYQNEHRMVERFSQLVEEVRDFGAEVRAVADQRFGEFLGIIALLGIPAVAASILQAVHANAVTATRWIVIVSAVVALPLLWLCGRALVSFMPTEWHL